MRDDDRPKRDSFPRTNREVTALDAAKALLSAYGIPIPASFDDLDNVPEPDFSRHVPEPETRAMLKHLATTGRFTQFGSQARAVRRCARAVLRHFASMPS